MDPSAVKKDLPEKSPSPAEEDPAEKDPVEKDLLKKDPDDKEPTPETKHDTKFKVPALSHLPPANKAECKTDTP